MSYAHRDVLAGRLSCLRDALRSSNLDVLLVSHPPNVFYLTGFAGSSGVLIVTRAGGSLITDFRYLESARELLASERGCPEIALLAVEGSYEKTQAMALARLGAPRIGFEAKRLSVSAGGWLARALGARLQLDPVETPATGTEDRHPVLVATEDLVERLRLRKDAGEIATLREAGKRIGEIAIRMASKIRAGRTEREIAADVDFAVRSAGFERPAFETIVASGPNGARPHARPGSRILAPGDLVVLDFGGVYDGYCVDLTRTISLSEPDSDRRSAYEAVLEAQEAAIQAVRPGVLASSVDAAAREVLGRHGLAELFGHGTGHGLGLEVHEEPRVARPPESPAQIADEELAEGMVFTVEPGVYLEGRWGIRIEDDVVVTARGCEILTAAPRELTIVPA
jgi:Xaa-Pro aminopeptidase